MNYNPRKEYRKTNAKTQELQYIKTSDNQREKKYKQVIRCPIRKNSRIKPLGTKNLLENVLLDRMQRISSEG